MTESTHRFIARRLREIPDDAGTGTHDAILPARPSAPRPIGSMTLAEAEAYRRGLTEGAAAARLAAAQLIEERAPLRLAHELARAILTEGKQ